MTETNSVHMPMLLVLEKGNKLLLAKYLKKYKHSSMAKKLALCSYWATTYRPGLYIPFKSFLLYSLEEDKEPTDAGLMKAWKITDVRYKNTFFGFDVGTIIYGNLNDVEAMITEWTFERDRMAREAEEIYNNL